MRGNWQRTQAHFHNGRGTQLSRRNAGDSGRNQFHVLETDLLRGQRTAQMHVAGEHFEVVSERP